MKKNPMHKAFIDLAVRETFLFQPPYEKIDFDKLFDEIAKMDRSPSTSELLDMLSR